MKPTLSLLMAMVILSTLARAADVKISAVTATGPTDEPTTTFAADTAKVFVLFKTKGVQQGDKIRGVWIAEDVGDAAPANSRIDEKTLTAEGDTNNGQFSLSKPTKGWPMGKYRVEIYVGDDLATKVNFSIGGSEKVEKKLGESAGLGKAKKETEESGAVPDEEQLKTLTEESLLSFGRAVKKQDFASFYEDIATVWQKQTSTEKLEAAFKDFFDKDIDLPAALNGLDPVFNHPASIDSDGVLVVKGYYPTKPSRVIFQLKYVEEEGDWKLIGINVNLKE